MTLHSGFVCILGQPNAGKSTLLNALVGQKIAIISPKPQTTRNRILGILNIAGKKKKGSHAAQIVLIDTPGVHKPDTSLGRKMMAEVREAMDGCDLVLVLIDAAKPRDLGVKFLFEFIQRSATPALLALNKIDILRGGKQKLLPLMEEYRTQYAFKEIIPISARRKEGLDLLLEKLIQNLPAGPRYFPEDQITDQPARFMVTEIIREQVLLQTQEEVPYGTTVAIEQFEEGKKLTRISAIIYCEREGHKRILIGRQGQMLKAIGTKARQEIEKMLGVKLYLELFVKVQPNWRESRQFVDELDWRRQLERMAQAQVVPDNNDSADS